MPDEQTPWVVKGVPLLTRRMVKSYAALNNMTMAQAVQLLISRGIAIGIAPTNDPAMGVLRDMPEGVLAELVHRVTEEVQRRNSMSKEDRLAEETERRRLIGLAEGKPSVYDIDAKELMAQLLRATENEN